MLQMLLPPAAAAWHVPLQLQAPAVVDAARSCRMPPADTCRLLLLLLPQLSGAAGGSAGHQQLAIQLLLAALLIHLTWLVL